MSMFFRRGGRLDVVVLRKVHAALVELAGTPPFTGADQNDLLGKHIYAAAPLVEAANRNVTPAASKLIRQMMAKKPADRPASMEEIIRQIKQLRFFERDPSAG